MKTLLDVHTHTIASGHAFSSLQEMTLTAKEKGLDILGITEHGPNIPGTCDPIYFRNLHCVPRQLYGIKLMLGAELNILNTKGDIDLDEDYWRMLDIRIAGIHSLCWQGGSKEENTQGVINAMCNPFVQIISHPGDGTAELDFEELMKVSRETHTLLEINNHSMAPIRHKTVTAPNNLELLELAILSCMDTRLTELLPAALGLKNGDAKLIKNAGGLVISPFDSAMRSLLVAIYELGVEEIMVIAHSNCGACHMNG